jgi:hypothetical protein
VQEVGDETAKDNSKAEGGDSETGTDMSSRKLGIDHFDNEQSNPIKSKAMSKFLLESFIFLSFQLIYSPKPTRSSCEMHYCVSSSITSLCMHFCLYRLTCP